MPDPLMRKVEMLFAPFDFIWPDRRVSVVRETGIISLHPDIAQAAIDAGMANAMPGDMPEAEQPSRSTSSAAELILTHDDETTLASEPDGMDRADLAGDGGADGELPGEASE